MQCVYQNLNQTEIYPKTHIELLSNKTNDPYLKSQTNSLSI
jgi:hypothetical protein